jgi:hypothetical protein
MAFRPSAFLLNFRAVAYLNKFFQDLGGLAGRNYFFGQSNTVFHGSPPYHLNKALHPH